MTRIPIALAPEMKPVAIMILVCSLTVAHPGFAQTPASSAPSAADSRIQCHVTAKVRGLRGADRKAFVAGCIAYLRPDLARKNACHASKPSAEVSKIVARACSGQPR